MIEVERVKHISVEEAIEVLAQDLPCETDEDLSEAMTMAIKALEQQPCEDWYDVPSDEMTLQQARQAVKDLRKKLAEYLAQQPCEDCISRKDMLAVLRQSHSLTQAWDGFEKSPSVTPKEKSEYEHDHEVVKAYNDGQAFILDKIRAEIDQKQYDFMSDGDYNEGIRFGLMLAYQIIDKYSEVSE